MAIQLSGATPRDFSFSSSGTRAELVTNFQNELTAAGWHVISGGGTGDVVMESATTPQGLKIRVEAIDPGSGNCVQFKLRDNGGLVGPVTIFLLPVGGATFRLWSNPYQFFYYLSGTDMTKQRALVCGGVPWVPPFIQDILSIPYTGWLHGNGASDTDTRTLTGTFRKTVTVSTIVNYSAIWNGVTFGVANAINVFGLVIQTGLTNLDDLWEDGTFTIFEPVLCWQSSGFSSPVRHGQMWDAVLGTKPLDSEVRRTFGNMTWRMLTHQASRFGLFLIVAVLT